MKKAGSHLSYGTGRRKCAIARVWLNEGDGSFTVNGRELGEYMGRPVLEIMARSPLTTLDLTSRYAIKAMVRGGGKSGQAGAIRLGIARALVELDETLRSGLRADGHLTRDARVKERKKYGRKKARRGFQFVKR